MEPWRVVMLVAMMVEMSAEMAELSVDQLVVAKVA